MLYVGSAFLSYDLITEMLRHHDENNLRPQIVDHTFALMIIGTIGGLMATNTLNGALVGWMVSTFALSPSLWWMKCNGLGHMSKTKPVNIFYQDDVTPEEIE